VKKLDFLGHEVSAAGSRPLQDNVAAVLNFPQLQTVKQLQALLGLINFYRRFIPAAAPVLKPLTDCLRGNQAGQAHCVQPNTQLSPPWNLCDETVAVQAGGVAGYGH
jgi:hypothetical protein